MKKYFVFLILAGSFFLFWFIYSEIFTAEAQYIPELIFKVAKGENVAELAKRLEQEQVIRNGWFFRKYVSWKKIDRKINHGSFVVKSPITLARVAEVLSLPGLNERTITIIPGWNIEDIASYFEKEGLASKDKVFNLIGRPGIDLTLPGETTPRLSLNYKILQTRPIHVSFEGYLKPDTYRIFTDARLEEIFTKLIVARQAEFSETLYTDIQKQGRTVHQILTMASILEREVKLKDDRVKVADIFWRRFTNNWALQADSTVHYAVGKKGEVFTTKEERASLNPWNTYRYSGLPPGPISTPGITSIMAAIYPEKNEYWYFLTTDQGEVKYAKSLEEQQKNIAKYLR